MLFVEYNDSLNECSVSINILRILFPSAGGIKSEHTSSDVISLHGDQAVASVMTLCLNNKATLYLFSKM